MFDSIILDCKQLGHTMAYGNPEYIFNIIDNQDELKYEFCSWDCMYEWIIKANEEINGI